MPSLRAELTRFVDEVLEQHGLQHRAVASTTALITIPMMLKTAPMIATLSARAARFSNATTLTVSSSPFNGPGFDVSMV